MNEHLVLLAVAVFLIWAVRAWFWPYAKCGWCRGTGRNHGSTPRRFGTCRFCRGSGRRRVLGSRQVHRAVRAGRSASARRKDK